jgi:hypothetical protein
MSDSSRKKPVKLPALAGLVTRGLEDHCGAERYPHVVELCRPIFDAGVMVRQPAKVSIRVESGSWRVSIDCPTEGVVCVMVIDSIIDFWENVEAQLLGGKVHWSPNYESSKKMRPTLDD